MSSKKCETCVHGYRAGFYAGSKRGMVLGKPFYGCQKRIDTWDRGTPVKCDKYEPKGGRVEE